MLNGKPASVPHEITLGKEADMLGSKYAENLADSIQLYFSDVFSTDYFSLTKIDTCQLHSSKKMGSTNRGKG